MFQPKLTLHFTLYLSIYKAFDTTEGKPKGCVGLKHEPTGLERLYNMRLKIICSNSINCIT